MPTVKELREAKGWSQQELATRASVTIHTVGRMEKRKPVQRTSLVLVAQALGVTPEQVEGVVNRVRKRVGQ